MRIPSFQLLVGTGLHHDPAGPPAFPLIRHLNVASRYLPHQPQEVTEADVHATAVALLEAAQQLEGDIDAQQIQKSNQESEGRSQLRKYFLKRNYSGMTPSKFSGKQQDWRYSLVCVVSAYCCTFA